MLWQIAESAIHDETGNTLDGEYTSLYHLYMGKMKIDAVVSTSGDDAVLGAICVS